MRIGFVNLILTTIVVSLVFAMIFPFDPREIDVVQFNVMLIFTGFVNSTIKRHSPTRGLRTNERLLRHRHFFRLPQVDLSIQDRIRL